MCTSIIYQAGDSYFGRNLDLEVSLGQQVVITPRNMVLNFRKLPTLDHHYAMIGMSIVRDNYPLYFDGINEKGVGMAGLNFDGPAHYFPIQEGKDNIGSFELIPYVLAQAASVAEAKELLANANIADINFSAKMQAAPLHWIIADKTGASVTVESTTEGLNVYDNPVGVLTNNPKFPDQLINLSNYQSVSPAEPQNTLAPGVKLPVYSRGFGSHFLPGGMDSESRFVKATFVKMHAPIGDNEVENITNYFHILQSVEQQKGLDEVAPNTYEYTIYSDGSNLTKGIFYYRTYDNGQINAVDMHKEDLESTALITYPVNDQQKIEYQN
ncbi:choloylglycine hydrolase family protein [Limosilactobacillus sp. STM2_1]|uniref:choloylglycine hydrolase n=1 Tax=Limosilactobacillus rudii TaxID=2759755 RepID=A0A7W3UL86_9LACO|nr:choloylglycine hydrolase [Limosilactobacillus rudii]MBB1078339.1 choloylglycine hydrolase family protein [Limosilactobacillus rudii]MBB1096935.1 choloylglycine hydrolase family protein [Limosilactobacillus rudii]MCD7134065.1 choloylglycine hydrolase [Limosilactobacillus rudii]